MSNAHSPEKGVALDAGRLHAAVDAFYDSAGNTLQGVRAAIIAWEASKPAVEKAAPDLLNAVKAAVPFLAISDDFRVDSRLRIARAAIARATEGV